MTRTKQKPKGKKLSEKEKIKVYSNYNFKSKSNLHPLPPQKHESLQAHIFAYFERHNLHVILQTIMNQAFLNRSDDPCMYMAERLYELKNSTAEQQFLAENKQLKSQLEVYRLENFELRKNSGLLQRRCDAMERQLKASSKQNQLFKPNAGASSSQYHHSPPMISIPLAELACGNSVTQQHASNQFVGALIPQNQQIKSTPAKVAAVNAVAAAKRFVNQLNLSESESSSESDSSSSDEEPEEKSVEAPEVLTVKVERDKVNHETIEVLDNVLIQEASIPKVQPVTPSSSGTADVENHVDSMPIAEATTKSFPSSELTNGCQETATIGDTISSDVKSEAVAIEQLPAPPTVEVQGPVEEQSAEEGERKKDVLSELVGDIIGDDSESSQSLVIDLKDVSDAAWKEIDNAIDTMKQEEAPGDLNDIDTALKTLLESGNGRQPENDQMEISIDYDGIEEKLQRMEGSSDDDMKSKDTLSSEVPESKIPIDKQSDFSESEGEMCIDLEADVEEVIAKPVAQASIETQDDFEPDYEAEDD